MQSITAFGALSSEMFTAEENFENCIELKEAILQEWEALPQAVINNAINGFRARVRLVIAENGQHIEKY